MDKSCVLKDNPDTTGRGHEHEGITRRGLIAAGAVAGAGLAVGARSASGSPEGAIRSVNFSAMADHSGWPAGWVCTGVANLSVAGGLGVLQSGSDVFPYDPRPTAFAVDARFVQGTVQALVTAAGSLVGVIVRRVSPREYYAALYTPEEGLLSIVRRSDSDLVPLASVPVPAMVGEFTLALSAASLSPTDLTARITALGGIAVRATTRDGHPQLQRPGDAGVLGQARTLFPSGANPVLPGLGNAHLLPYGVAQGQAFISSPEGQALIDEIKRESTVKLRQITITSNDSPQPTPASIIAATTTVPLATGARVRLATDLPVEVSVEISETPGFEHPRRLTRGSTGDYEGYEIGANGFAPGSRAYWRATVHRAGTSTVGPVRSFPVLPPAGDPGPARIAIASCAAQFGPIFDDLISADPDVFVWMGDLNYPDTVGPLAQTMTGYAGIWRDFLANPLLAPLFERSAFVPMRDDHDYGANDSNSTVIPHLPWGIAPWDALLGRQIGCTFSAGLADFWVLDQRRFKANPRLPDKPGKTLIGTAQREWLQRTLRASTAPFKVICSPCTVFMSANGTDGNWSNGFTAERDEILAYIDRHVSGRVIFIAGDFHLTGVYDKDGRYEARPCPLDIPVPNDITLDDPNYAQHLSERPGVTYADNRSHFGLVDVHGDGDNAVLTVSLRREDGTTPYTKSFTEPIPAPALRLSAGRVSYGGVPVTVSLDRPGLVRLTADLTRFYGEHRGTLRLASRTVRIEHAGSRRLTLRFGRAGRIALRHHGQSELTVTAQYRGSNGRATTRHVHRVLRR